MITHYPWWEDIGRGQSSGGSLTVGEDWTSRTFLKIEQAPLVIKVPGVYDPYTMRCLFVPQSEKESMILLSSSCNFYPSSVKNAASAFFEPLQVGENAQEL